MDQFIHATAHHHGPWNKGKLVGQKAPLRLKEIWGMRIRLKLAARSRELALFNLAIDSKLRSCDLVRLRVYDVSHGERIATRATVMQQKTQRPVQFEITEQTRESLAAWIRCAGLRSDDFLFPSRLHDSRHLSTRQYARIVRGWVNAIGLDPAAYGTHTMRRTKASLIYRRTKNLRAVQLLLGHTKLESTVRYLGIEVDEGIDTGERFVGLRPARRRGSAEAVPVSAMGRIPPLQRPAASGQKRTFASAVNTFPKADAEGRRWPRRSPFGYSPVFLLPAY